MQSHNYVQGVSGWKMHSSGTLEVYGKIRAIMEDPVEKPATPFAVQGEQIILTQAFINDGKIPPVGFLRTTTNSAGQTVLAGIGVGLSCMCKGGYTGTPGDKEEKAEVKTDCTVDASKALDQIGKVLSTTKLAHSIESVAAKITQEASARQSADETMSARIGSVEAALQSLSARLAAKQ